MPHRIDRRIVTVPDDERIDVVPTPEYLRNVVPFAAYFSPPKFDPNPKGIYIVTPSVGDDPNAMREHNRASISNTSIHEAYPGHHLQLDVARRRSGGGAVLVDRQHRRYIRQCRGNRSHCPAPQRTAPCPPPRGA